MAFSLCGFHPTLHPSRRRWGEPAKRKFAQYFRSFSDLRRNKAAAVIQSLQTIAVLGFFRNNQFTTVFSLALYVGLTHLASLLGFWPPQKDVVVKSGVLYDAWFSWTIANPFFSAAGAAVLVFFQAVFINRLADEFRILNERTWLPGLFYALVTACLPDFLYLSPPLIALTFVPVVLNRIFKTYKQPAATGLIFDAAFWTIIASFFYPPAIYMLIAVYGGIHVMRAFKLKEQMVFFSGILTALFIAWLWYFWTDRGGEFWAIQFGGLVQQYHFESTFNTKILLESIVMGALFLIVLLSYGTYSFRKLNQIQKYVGVLYWFLFVSGLTMLVQSNPPTVHLLLLMPSMGIFLSMTFSAFKNKMIAELMHLVLLGYVLFVQFASKFILAAG